MENINIGWDKKPTSNLWQYSLLAIDKYLNNKVLTATELVQTSFEKIKKSNSEINAFIHINEEDALKEAKLSDERIARDERLSQLDGIPIAIKDNISINGVRTTAGSKMLEDYSAPYDATVVKKLKEAGAILIGKTNMDEFAMGSSTETSYFGPTRNPHDLERVPGGSSGGSAAAVANGMCFGALGSDTGGSIRQPAAFCQVVGLKPTYGAVSRYGLLAMASSLDQIGPFGKDVQDTETLFKAICGRDKMDSTSVDYTYKALPDSDLADLKIGMPKEFFEEGLDEQIRKKLDEAKDVFIKSGAKIKEVSLPHTKYALATYYIIMPAEVSSNLARYDGIRYGLSKAGKNLIDGYLETRAEGFGAEVKRRIMLGTYVLSAGYYEAYYKKAQQVRTLVKKDYDNVWKEVDILLTPVSPTLPFKIGEKVTSPLEMYMSDVMTVPANIAGLPAISIPYGKIGKLPAAIQLIGKNFDEARLFKVGIMFDKLINM